MKYTKNDIKILWKIADMKATNRLLSCSVNTIIDKCNLSNTKVRATIKILLTDTLIEEGFRNKNAKSYYLTEKGINFLRELGYNNEI